MAYNFHAPGTKYVEIRDEEIVLLDSSFSEDFQVVGPKWSLKKPSEQVLVRGSYELMVQPEYVLKSMNSERYIQTQRPSLLSRDIYMVLELEMPRKYPNTQPIVTVQEGSGISIYQQDEVKRLLSSNFQKSLDKSKTSGIPECFLHTVLTESVLPYVQSMSITHAVVGRVYENLASLKVRASEEGSESEDKRDYDDEDEVIDGMIDMDELVIKVDKKLKKTDKHDKRGKKHDKADKKADKKVEKGDKKGDKADKADKIDKADKQKKPSSRTNTPSFLSDTPEAGGLMAAFLDDLPLSNHTSSSSATLGSPLAPSSRAPKTYSPAVKSSGSNAVLSLLSPPDIHLHTNQQRNNLLNANKGKSGTVTVTTAPSHIPVSSRQTSFVFDKSTLEVKAPVKKSFFVSNNHESEHSNSNSDDEDHDAEYYPVPKPLAMLSSGGGDSEEEEEDEDSEWETYTNKGVTPGSTDFGDTGFTFGGKSPKKVKVKKGNMNKAQKYSGFTFSDDHDNNPDDDDWAVNDALNHLLPWGSDDEDEDEEEELGQSPMQFESSPQLSRGGLRSGIGTPVLLGSQASIADSFSLTGATDASDMTYDEIVNLGVDAHSRYKRDYKHQGIIGQGGQGKVFRSENQFDGVEYAVKRIRVSGSDADKLRREMRIFSTFNHSRIVRYFQSWEEVSLGPQLIEGESLVDDDDPDASDEDEEDDSIYIGNEASSTAAGLKVYRYLYISMELCENRTLETLQEHGRSLDHRFWWKISTQLLEALSYLHGQGVVHRDLKPANVFIDKDNNVKLGDFGLAVRTNAAIESSSLSGEPNTPSVVDMSSNIGTPMYMAPEQRFNSRYDTQADIFSLGIIFYEMWSGFEHDTSTRYRELMALHKHIKEQYKGERDDRLQQPAWFMDRAFSCRYKCPVPSCKLSVSEIPDSLDVEHAQMHSQYQSELRRDEQNQPKLLTLMQQANANKRPTAKKLQNSELIPMSLTEEDIRPYQTTLVKDSSNLGVIMELLFAPQYVATLATPTLDPFLRLSNNISLILQVLRSAVYKYGSCETHSSVFVNPSVNNTDILLLDRTGTRAKVRASLLQPFIDAIILSGKSLLYSHLPYDCRGVNGAPVIGIPYRRFEIGRVNSGLNVTTCKDSFQASFDTIWTGYLQDKSKERDRMYITMSRKLVLYTLEGILLVMEFQKKIGVSGGQIRVTHHDVGSVIADCLFDDLRKQLSDSRSQPSGNGAHSKGVVGSKNGFLNTATSVGLSFECVLPEVEAVCRNNAVAFPVDYNVFDDNLDEMDQNQVLLVSKRVCNEFYDLLINNIGAVEKDVISNKQLYAQGPGHGNAWSSRSGEAEVEKIVVVRACRMQWDECVARHGPVLRGRAEERSDLLWCVYMCLKHGSLNEQYVQSLVQMSVGSTSAKYDKYMHLLRKAKDELVLLEQLLKSTKMESIFVTALPREDKTLQHGLGFQVLVGSTQVAGGAVFTEAVAKWSRSVEDLSPEYCLYGVHAEVDLSAVTAHVDIQTCLSSQTARKRAASAINVQGTILNDPLQSKTVLNSCRDGIVFFSATSSMIRRIGVSYELRQQNYRVEDLFECTRQFAERFAVNNGFQYAIQIHSDQRTEESCTLFFVKNDQFVEIGTSKLGKLSEEFTKLCETGLIALEDKPSAGVGASVPIYTLVGTLPKKDRGVATATTNMTLITSTHGAFSLVSDLQRVHKQSQVYFMPYSQAVIRSVTCILGTNRRNVDTADLMVWFNDKREKERSMAEACCNEQLKELRKAKASKVKYVFIHSSVENTTDMVVL